MIASLLSGAIGWAIAIAIIVGCIAFPIWAIVDAARRPDVVWRAVGRSKVTWVVLIAVPLGIVPPISLVIALFYVLSIRRRLIQVER